MPMTRSPRLPISAYIAAVAAFGLLSLEIQSQTCPAAQASDFKKETLSTGAVLKQPIELSVAKDGKVFVVERAGDIHLYDPATSQVTLALHMDVYLHSGAYDVGGPLGIAVAPNFPTDNWVYIYWAPKSGFTGSANKESGKVLYRLARYRFAGGKIDINTEQTLFEVPSRWETHNGGSLKFGKDGDLYLSTGDNDNPGCSEQYSPMDEQPGHFWCDDQGTTANTNDLRGKIIRIHPEEVKQANNLYYTIPKNNLKEKYLSIWSVAEQALVRPEIYTMGHRNPYRIFPDPVTGKLFIAENGPASQSDAERGPAGADQWKVTDEAAFLGYPYFLKDNQPYCHWDYAQGKCVAIAGQTGMKFDPATPRNNSPNNTGAKILPPAKPAALWEHDGGNTDPIPGLRGCGPGAGPVYHYDATSSSKIKFPMDFDGKWIFFGIFSPGWQPKLTTPPANFAPIKTASTPPWGNLNFSQGLHDMEFGPGDGALYVVDYGDGQYNDNSSAGLFKITYNGCQLPVSLGRNAGQGLNRAYVTLQGLDERLVVPMGATGLELFNIAGKKVWQTSMATGTSHLTMPGSLGKGMFRALWK
jgi:cytochrome c